jgi:hypothetical protein
VGVAPLLLILLDEPARVSWRWLGLTLVAAGVGSWFQFTTGGRAAWEKDARKEIRVGHALRDHVSIGAADRDLATERAEKIDTVAWGGLIGWPLLTALFVVPLVFSIDELPARIGVGLVGLLACVDLIRRNRRRVRWARRWLAAPLPRDEQA